MKTLFVYALLLITMVAVGAVAQAPALKPAPVATHTAPDLKEISIPRDAAAEYQILDLKHQLALAQFNGKIAEFLATPEMLDLRANVLGYQAGMRSKAIGILDAAHVPADEIQNYSYVASSDGSAKFVRSPK